MCLKHTFFGLFQGLGVPITMRSNRKIQASFLITASAAMMLASPAFAAVAGVNLVGKIVGTPAIARGAGGTAKITISVEVKNIGSDNMTEEKTIRVKPFLVPEKTSSN